MDKNVGSESVNSSFDFRRVHCQEESYLRRFGDLVLKMDTDSDPDVNLAAIEQTRKVEESWRNSENLNNRGPARVEFLAAHRQFFGELGEAGYRFYLDNNDVCAPDFLRSEPEVQRCTLSLQNLHCGPVNARDPFGHSQVSFEFAFEDFYGNNKDHLNDVRSAIGNVHDLLPSKEAQLNLRILLPVHQTTVLSLYKEDPDYIEDFCAENFATQKNKIDEIAEKYQTFRYGDVVRELARHVRFSDIDSTQIGVESLQKIAEYINSKNIFLENKEYDLKAKRIFTHYIASPEPHFVPLERLNKYKFIFSHVVFHKNQLSLKGYRFLEKHDDVQNILVHLDDIEYIYPKP